MFCTLGFLDYILKKESATRLWAQKREVIMRHILRATRGAALAEYAVLLSLLVAGVFGVVLVFGQDIRDRFRDGDVAIRDAFASVEEAVASTPVEEEPQEGDPLVLVFRKTPRFEAYRIVDSETFPEPRIEWGPGGEACSTAFPKTNVTEQDMVQWDELNHVYTCPLGSGEHVVKIYGEIHMVTEFGADLKAVQSWGDTQIKSLEYAFAGATLLEDVPSSLPSTVRDMSHSFGRPFKTSDPHPPYHPFYLQAPPPVPAAVGGWNMGNVQEFDRMFVGQSPMAFPDLTGWDVSAGETFAEMFAHTTFNQPIGVWNTASLEQAPGMFWNNPAFNRDLNGWDVSGLWNTDAMFSAATAFNGDLSAWNTGELYRANNMFEDAVAFNRDITGWDTKYLTNASFMFKNATAFSYDLSGWNVDDLYAAKSMFENAGNLRGDYTLWRPGQMEFDFFDGMFHNATLATGDLSCWDAQLLTRPAVAFSEGSGITQEPLWGQPRAASCVD